MKKLIKQKLKFIKKLLPKKKKEKQRVAGIENVLQILKTKRTFAMILAVAVVLSGLISLYPTFFKTKAVVYNPGDVLINEFYTYSDVGVSQWYELMNTTSADIDLTGWILSSAINGDTNIGTALGANSKILPANGLLTFETAYTPADDLGDVLQLKDPTTQVLHAFSYGDQIIEGMDHAGVSISFDTSVNWGIESWGVGDTTRGWFNNYAFIDNCATMSELVGPPLLAQLDECLGTLIDVVSNIGEIPDPSRTPNDGVNNLYFEKQDLGVPIGKIKYNTSLNLTDANTMALLIALGNKMDMAAGEIAFDASMSEMMRASGAEITIYSIDDLGYTSAPNIVVRDDLGEIILPESPNYPSIVGVSYSEMGDLTFSTDHFTGFEVGPTVTEVSALGSTSNTTPEYTFNTDVSGTGNITYGGSCTSITTDSFVGNNTIIFDILSEGVHDDCTITVTDLALHSTTLNVSSFTIDTIAPIITEVTPVPELTNDSTPSYTFSSDEAGTIEYNGDYCAGDLTEAVAGENTTVLYDWNTDDILEDGLYSGTNCIIEVRDAAGNLSEALILEFTIDTTVPTLNSILGDGLSNYELPSTCPSVACDRGDIYGTSLVFSEELSADGKTAVEDALSSEASVAPRTFAWSTNRLRIYATEITTFTKDLWAQIEDIAGNINVIQIIDAGTTSSQINDETPVDISDDDAQLIIPETTTEVNVNIDENSDDSSLNLGDYEVDGEIAESPEINITKTLPSGDDVIVNIPAGTSIVADDPSWNGVINVPQIKDNSTVTISGGTVDGVVEIGFNNIKLTFGDAVRLFFQNKAGKRIGYSRDGVFTEITAVCADDSQVTGNALPAEGDCGIDVGSDLIVWTKHFTSFVTYTSTGGGSPSAYSAPVTPPVSDTGIEPPLSPIQQEIINQIQFRTQVPVVLSDEEKVRRVSLTQGTYAYELITQSPYPAALTSGQEVDVWIEVKNTGTATWFDNGDNVVRLGSGSQYGSPSQQRDYNSEFANANWYSANRPTNISHPEVRPGWHTRFQFKIKAPMTIGTYKAYFAPVVDGITWMKDIGIYWEIVVR